MNKSFARFAAAGLAAVSFFAFSACGGQNPGVTGGGGNNPAMPDYGVGLSVVGTVTPDPNAPTEEPTEAPSEAPTAEPTATPLPEGWYIDPRGLIPPEVEIIVPDDGFHKDRACGIIEVDGNPVLVVYTKEGKVLEQKLPKEFLNAKCVDGGKFGNEIVVSGYQTTGDDPEILMKPYSFYYQVNGKYFCFEARTMYGDEKDILIATTDGKAVWYRIGDDFYTYDDYGEGAEVSVSGSKNFCVGDRTIGLPSQKRGEMIPIE